MNASPFRTNVQSHGSLPGRHSRESRTTYQLFDGSLGATYIDVKTCHFFLCLCPICLFSSVAGYVLYVQTASRPGVTQRCTNSYPFSTALTKISLVYNLLCCCEDICSSWEGGLRGFYSQSIDARSVMRMVHMALHTLQPHTYKRTYGWLHACFRFRGKCGPCTPGLGSVRRPGLKSIVSNRFLVGGSTCTYALFGVLYTDAH